MADRFVAATEKMKRDGWWWHDAFPHQQGHPRQILKEMLTRKRFVGKLIATVPIVIARDAEAIHDGIARMDCFVGCSSH